MSAAWSCHLAATPQGQHVQGRHVESDATRQLDDDAREGVGEGVHAEMVDAAANDGVLSPLARYTRPETMGAGGAGVVYRAYDLELRRHVAIKVVRTETAGATGSAASRPAEARLLREARSLAKLAHPNVVAVHDVGTCLLSDLDDWLPDGSDQRSGGGKAVFVVMELVEGRTLSEWLERPRPWQQVVRVFLQAGRGLAAAHAVGLVHRDFKPSNVIIGDDDRARVLDFGLARRAEAFDDTVAAIPARADVAALGHSRLQITAHGAIAGTPAYMAPEQHAGQTADARADQFAFCASLFEGLTGRQPFRGADIFAIGEAKAENRIVDVPTRAAPRRLVRVVTRGLAPDPAARYASLDELLDVIERLTRRRRRAAILIAGPALAAMAGATVVTSFEPSRELACDTPETELMAGVWDEPRRAELSRRVLATGVHRADQAWRHIETQLSNYATQWQAAWQQHCHADPVDIETTRCLDRRRRSLDAVVGVMEEVTADAVFSLASSLEVLPSLHRCSSATRNKDLGETPDDSDVETYRRAMALYRLGRSQEARAAANEALGKPASPTLGRWHLLLGKLEQTEGAREAAKASFTSAWTLAEKTSDDALVTESMIELANMAIIDGSYEEADRLVTLAGARRSRHGPELGAAIDIAAAFIAFRKGDFPAAKARLASAADSYDTQQGGPSPERAKLRAALGAVLTESGEHATAIEVLEQLIDEDGPLLGPFHSMVGYAWGNIGTARGYLHQFAAQAKAAEKGAQILGLARGEAERGRILFAQDHAAALLALGYPRRALPVLEELQRTVETHYGEKHGHLMLVVATTRTEALLASGRPTDAADTLAVALQAYDTAKHGGEAPNELANHALRLARVAGALDQAGLAAQKIAAADEYFSKHATNRVWEARLADVELERRHGQLATAIERLEQIYVAPADAWRRALVALETARLARHARDMTQAHHHASLARASFATRVDDWGAFAQVAALEQLAASCNLPLAAGQTKAGLAAALTELTGNERRTAAIAQALFVVARACETVDEQTARRYAELALVQLDALGSELSVRTELRAWLNR